MRTTAIVVLVALAACDRSGPDSHVLKPIILGPFTETDLTDAVSVGDRTWFLLGPSDFQVDGRRATNVCTLVAHQLSCVTVPASKWGAHLTDASDGATPLLALPIVDESQRRDEDDRGPVQTLYVEPFTWRTVHRVEGVSFRDRAVALADGTLWIERKLEHAVLMVPASGAVRRLEMGNGDFWVSRAGLIWSAEREVVVDGANSIVAELSSAAFHAGGLAPTRNHPATAGLHAYVLCHDGPVIGYFDLSRQELVRADLRDEHVVRVPSQRPLALECASGAVTATNGMLSSNDPPIAWCDVLGCKTSAALRFVPYTSGRYVPVAGGVLAVASSGEHAFMTWRVGGRLRFWDVPRSNGLGLAHGVPIAGGVLIVLETGELMVFDDDGLPLPVQVTDCARFPYFGCVHTQ